MVYINDLPKLHDITDNIVLNVNKENIKMNSKDECEIIETLLCLLDEVMKENIKLFNEPDYKEKMFQLLFNESDELFNLNDDMDNIDDETLEDLCDKSIDYYFTFIPERSRKGNSIIEKQTEEIKQNFDEKIQKLNEINKTLPNQREEQWYKDRYNKLSASSAWKCLDKQNYKNAIIYEKCQPLNVEKYQNVNINSPFHWGQKYEPVSQMYYEYTYDAEIKEYGCIPHSKYSFLGASPDGINIKRSSERYGRLLEIKNIVNRVINGIPKKEYWIQTQMQMECCNLDECDFLECQFKEYENEEDFKNDGSFQFTKDGNYKGIILQFFQDNKPLYEYAPFNCNEKEYNEWYHQIMEKYKDITWVQTIYWRLEKVSCVLIERNKFWFENVIDEFKSIWNTILHERENGHEHRKPQKRTKQTNVVKIDETGHQINGKNKLHNALVINIDI